TALGTAAAIGLRNVGTRLRSAFDVSMYAALIVPEIVIAIASLLFFTTVGFPLGPYAIVLTHAVFNTSVVLLICRARLASMDRTLEEAGPDLGAGPRGRFVRVTLPQLFPAVLAGGLLAFTFSFDDVVLSTFVSAPGATTLPLKVFSQLRLGLTPEPNIVAPAMLTITFTLIITAQGGLRRAGRPRTARGGGGWGPAGPGRARGGGGGGGGRRWGAQTGGVGESFLSQVERGVASPSVASLRAIAGALDASIAAFFEEGGEISGTLVRAGDRRSLTYPGRRIEDML